MNGFIKKHLILIFAFAIAGCASTQPEKSWIINYENKVEPLSNFADDGIILVGLVGSYTGLNDKEKYELDAIFSKTLNRYFNSTSVLDPYEITQIFGFSSYKNLIIRDSSKSEFSQIDSNLRASLSEHGKYVLYYQILKNHIDKSTYKTGHDDCYSSSRELTVEVSVFEISSYERVWGGELSGSPVNTNCNPRSSSNTHYPKHVKEIGQDIMVNAFVDVVSNVVFGTYPKAPSLKTSSETLFSGFAENMPGADLKLNHLPRADMIPDQPLLH